MNMKKMKAFFTMKRHANDGFTLVELIVVIAILAILGGVAVPAYSGYVEKSKRAGDEVLLKAVNEAYASACLMNGSDIYLVGEGVCQLNTDGTVAYVAKSRAGDDYNVAFTKFFEGNEDAKFEVFKKIEFDPYVAKFVDENDVTSITITFGGKQYTFKQTDIDAIKDSVYAKNVPAMQNQLSAISAAFGNFIGTVDTAGTISPAFKAFMTENGYSDADLGNAAVLYVAKNAENYTAQDVADMFQNCGNYIGAYMKEHNGQTPAMGDIMKNAFDEGSDGLTNAALMYGAVTAFANSNKCNDTNLKNTVANVSSGSELVNLFMGLNGNTEWSNYLGSAYDPDGDGVKDKVAAGNQFTTDMNGFFGAMDAINTVSPGVDTDDANFWKENEDVNKLLGELLG